jgi:hypothetical protein
MDGMVTADDDMASDVDGMVTTDDDMASDVDDMVTADDDIGLSHGWQATATMT